jgi:hypothetical protein
LELALQIIKEAYTNGIKYGFGNDGNALYTKKNELNLNKVRHYCLLEISGYK